MIVPFRIQIFFYFKLVIQRRNVNILDQSRMCGKGVGLGFFLKSKNGPFLTIFGLILAMFLTSQPYDFDAIAHIGL